MAHQRLSNETRAVNKEDLMANSIESIWFLQIFTNLFYIVGIPANIITLIVLQKKVMKDNFMSCFLSASCIVDLWCLGTGFSVYWYMGVSGGEDLRDFSYWQCIYHWFITLTGLQINEWLIVVVSITRVYHIQRSKRSKSQLTKLLALVIIGGVFLVAMVPGYFVIESNLRGHYIISRFKIHTCEIRMNGILDRLYYFVTMILPPFLVIALNYEFMRLFKAKTPEGMRRRLTTIAAQQRVRMQMIFTDIIFFVTSVPPLVYFDISGIMDSRTDSIMIDIETIIMTCLLYSGFTFNVFIYCCFGRRFRVEVKALLLKPLHKLGLCSDVQAVESFSGRHYKGAPLSWYTQSQTSSLPAKSTEDVTVPGSDENVLRASHSSEVNRHDARVPEEILS